MKTVRIILGLALLAAIVAAVLEVVRRREAATTTADAIRAQLDELDPATRAMVRTSLARDTVRGVSDKTRRVGGILRRS